jgi:hypothetical protein
MPFLRVDAYEGRSKEQVKPACAGWRTNLRRKDRDSANIISMLFWIE